MRPEEVDVANQAKNADDKLVVRIVFDTNLQTVVLDFDNKKIKTFAMLKFLCESALEQAKEMQEGQKLMAMQQQMAAMQQGQVMANNLAKRRLVT